MTTPLVGSNNNYYGLIGDTWLAQTNRIYQLATGKMPNDIDYNNMLGGSVVYSSSVGGTAPTVNALNQDLNDIQTALGAMESSASGLEDIETRINIVLGLASVIEENPNITDVQRRNINEQINNALYEINEIAETQGYNNVPVLDGSLEAEGVYLSLFGGNSIDISDAFSSATPEALGLPRQGEAYVTSDNASELYEKIDNALTAVYNQQDRISTYSDDLVSAFGEIKDAAVASYSSSYAITPIVNSLNPSTISSSNNLVLNMGNISGNLRIDNSYYERIMSLLA